MVSDPGTGASRAGEFRELGLPHLGGEDAVRGVPGYRQRDLLAMLAAQGPMTTTALAAWWWDTDLPVRREARERVFDSLCRLQRRGLVSRRAQDGEWCWQVV